MNKIYEMSQIQPMVIFCGYARRENWESNTFYVDIHRDDIDKDSQHTRMKKGDVWYWT